MQPNGTPLTMTLIMVHKNSKTHLRNKKKQPFYFLLCNDRLLEPTAWCTGLYAVESSI